MANIFQIKRRTSGSADAPASLANGELAYNEVDDSFYYGKADLAVNPIGGVGKYATLETAQSITGDKTFSASVVLSSAVASTLMSTATGVEVATTEFVQSVFAVIDGGDFEGNGYVPPTPSGTGVYFYSTSSTDWFSTSNWYTNSSHTLPAANLPDATIDVVILGSTTPIVDLDSPSWVQPNSIDSGTAGIVFTSQNNGNVSINITGNATFQGNATFSN
jgi:hypothetical protein